MYSPPLSILRDFIFLPDGFSTEDLKILKKTKTSNLNWRKKTQQNLEKSAMKVRTYLALLKEKLGNVSDISL